MLIRCADILSFCMMLRSYSRNMTDVASGVRNSCEIVEV